VYRCGDCELDTANRIFRKCGTEYTLEPKVFAVLVQLVTRSGELLTRDQLLDAVWGHQYVTPSTLNRVISLARRALSDAADGPKLIQTVHGAGYRYVGPTEEVMSSTEPRARFGPPPAARLPERLQELIGRVQELAQIDTLLQGGRSLTILGTGGMGKTQCALAFAHEQADRYPDGVWFFDLVPMRTADDWLRALALALSIAPSSSRELLDKVVQTMVNRKALLVIDNCDRLSSQIGALIVELLRATDRLKVLATSQQKLNFVGERLLRLPPLRLPSIRHPANQQELMEVATAPAVALLLARIRDAQSDFELTAAHAPVMVDICERLDGMPLALELAAARFAMLSPEQVLERLDQRFRFLISDVAGRDPRHRNLIALLEWSFGLLSPDEQRLLAWLGVFVQGWTVDAVIAFASPFGSTPETMVDLLTGLANKSLVAIDQSLSPPRYRLLESVREFALKQLKVLGDEHRARDAHLAYILRMSEAAHRDMLGDRMRERIALLAQEHGNIECACDYALAAGKEPQAALRIAGLLMLYFKAHGAVAFGLGLVERALQTTDRSPARERGQALMCRGVLGVFSASRAPEPALTGALSIARANDDRWTEAYASAFLAMWVVHMGRAVEAEPHLLTAERISKELEDPLLRGAAGLARGWWHIGRNEVDDAIRILRAVRALGGDAHQHHFIDMYIGLALFQRAEYAAAAAQWHAALRNAIAVGHTRGIAGSIEGCGYIAERQGRLEQACQFLCAAEQIRHRTEIPLFSFWQRHNAFAKTTLRAALGSARYDAAVTVGASMKEEDVSNEAAVLLHEFGAGIKAS
jgi:predicted ATPase/DNA-binding winged helix-turn-helix (wHTH) protein